MSQSAVFDYYYDMHAEAYSFYKMPKVLFTDTYFREVSCEAKVLYGLMLDRMSLSRHNRWIDDQGRVYIIFSVDDVCEMLGCCRQSAIKYLSELDTHKGIGLIEKKRRGLGKANIIYVKNFLLREENSEYPERTDNNQKPINDNIRSPRYRLKEVQKIDIKKSKDYTSRSAHDKTQKVYITNSNKTDLKKNDEKKTTTVHTQEVVDQVKDVFTPLGLSIKDIQAIAKASGFDLDKCAYAKEVYDHQRGPVRNVTGWLIDAVKKEYALTPRIPPAKNPFNNFSRQIYTSDVIDAIEKELLEENSLSEKLNSTCKVKFHTED